MSKEPRDSAQRKRDRARIKATRANCYLCGGAIDYELPHTDPMSFVVDHVIPIAKGGVDNLSNKAATHWKCNSLKAARLVAPIIRRSGALS